MEFQKNGKTICDLIDEDFIGLYYRVDTTFVSSMRNGEEENWGKVFETYLGICILKELLDLIIEFSSVMTINEMLLSEFAVDFSRRLNSKSNIADIYSFRKECDRHLDTIEDKINGMSMVSDLRYININRFINDACKSANILLNKTNLVFKIFIDEYETLQIYQQRIVNTLIKHSTLPVIYNIGLKPHGMRTVQTISETETIEAPHDFELVSLGFDNGKYSQLLKEICRKRIVFGKQQGRIPPEASDDIEFYLNHYSIEHELNHIDKTKAPHVSELKKLIEERGKEEACSEEQISQYIEAFCEKADILYSRIYYALLKRKTQYTPSLSELYNELCSESARYQEWIHNRKNGAVFLLCKETKRKKMYFGFDVYTMLSSNNVRCFLELCEQAFKFSFLAGYYWNAPISEERQTEAAYYVSDYKITDIAGYEPYGRELRIFVQYLGNIFYSLHTEKDSTIGEPEPNHFSTKDLSLPRTLEDVLSSALLCNVLQEGEANKRKQSKRSPETVDYHLNKIYTPYFGISYRDQRKIFLPVDILEELLQGDEDIANNAMLRFLNNRKDSSKEDNIDPRQISLFDLNSEE